MGGYVGSRIYDTATTGRWERYHLESSNIGNVPFYQRHGFEVVTMRREPR